MAYDGIFINAQLTEISNTIINEHISKITQSSHKEVSFHIHKYGKDLSLSLNANPNFPHILLKELDVENLKTPTSFCMLLRKYIQGGIIKNIIQVGANTEIDSVTINSKSLERIVRFSVENIDENGDTKMYFIFFEIMGKYSNVIVTDENLTILDTLYKNDIVNTRLKLKNKYSIKEIATKIEINSESYENFLNNIVKEKSLSKINNEQFELLNTICKLYAGISKQYLISSFIDFCDITKTNYSYQYDISELKNFNVFYDIINKNMHKAISPTLYYKNEKPNDFYIYKLNQYDGKILTFDNINDLVYAYQNEKFSNLNDSNLKNNLYDTVKKLYTKLNKKLIIYNEDLDKCKDFDKYKTYAELISAYGYDANNIDGEVLKAVNYNNNNEIINIPIDSSISISKNVEKYYSKYNKLKRTKETVLTLIEEVSKKLLHLDTIKSSIDLSNNVNDLNLIKEEILEYFDESRSIDAISKAKKDTLKKSNVKKKNYNYNISHFKSTSGVDIYVGKNNLQNEYLTFTLADSNDTWLHIKNATGAHVIVKCPYDTLDEKTLIEAASLAAYFSDKKNETKATVDYTLKKELKKVKGKAPGFCIYHKNFSINVKPELILKEI